MLNVYHITLADRAYHSCQTSQGVFNSVDLLGNCVKVAFYLVAGQFERGKSCIILNMDWQVIFYIDGEGNEPVKDFILGQPDGAIAEILHVFKLLRQFNIKLGMPYVRKIDKSGIRELRIKHGSGIYRIFFFAYTGRKFILLHAILKKEDKIIESDKKTAIQRMNDYISRCSAESNDERT